MDTAHSSLTGLVTKRRMCSVLSENTKGNEKLVRRPAQGSAGLALVWGLETMWMLPQYQACSKDEVTLLKSYRIPSTGHGAYQQQLCRQAYSPFNRYTALFSLKIQ